METELDFSHRIYGIASQVLREQIPRTQSDRSMVVYNDERGRTQKEIVDWFEISLFVLQDFLAKRFRDGKPAQDLA